MSYEVALLVSEHSHNAGDFFLDVYFDSETKHLQERTPDSIEVRENEHLENAIVSLIPHSCNPNLYFNKQEGAFYARRKIEVDEPLSYDYNETETRILEPFNCNCAEPNCRGLIE